MNDLTALPGAGTTILTGVTDANPYDVLFRPAKPTLDAIVQIWDSMRLLDRRRADPTELLKVIPPDAELKEARALFRQAEHAPAPESWTGIAVAMMVDSMPTAHRVSDAYVCSIIDSAYQDPETWENYQPGFSYGVIARSIREARRLEGLPSPGAFLEICSRHRRQFKKWQADVLTLINIRHDAIYGPCPF